MGNLECGEKGKIFCDFKRCVVATYRIFLFRRSEQVYKIHVDMEMVKCDQYNIK
jgi:hypothetical protein